MTAFLKTVLAIAVWLVATVLTVIAFMAFGTYLLLQVGDKTAIAGSFGFGLAAVLCAATAVRWYGWNKAWQPQLLILILAGFLAISMGFVNSGKSEGFSGGVSWNQDVDQNSGYASVPGHEMVDVWHRGHYPLGGFTFYRLHLKVSWSTNHHGYLTFDSRPTATASVTDENGFVKYDMKDLSDSTYLTTRIYGCSVHGHWRSHGCFFAKIKLPMTMTSPVPGVNSQTLYPWASVVVNSAGAVVVWDYSNSIS